MRFERLESTQDQADASIWQHIVDMVCGLGATLPWLWQELWEAFQTLIAVFATVVVLVTFPLSLPILAWFRRRGARREIASWTKQQADYEKILAARTSASDAHEGQTRKFSGKPYYTHPARVAQAVKDWPTLLAGCDRTKMIQAAYLHDVLEDCPQVSRQAIVDATSESVVKLVGELTNTSKGSSASREERKRMDRGRISKASLEARIIKLFDRGDNLRELKQDMLHNPAAVVFARTYVPESQLLLTCLQGTLMPIEYWVQGLIDEIKGLLSGKYHHITDAVDSQEARECL